MKKLIAIIMLFFLISSSGAATCNGTSQASCEKTSANCIWSNDQCKTLTSNACYGKGREQCGVSGVSNPYWCYWNYGSNVVCDMLKSPLSGPLCGEGDGSSSGTCPPSTTCVNKAKENEPANYQCKVTCGVNRQPGACAGGQWCVYKKVATSITYECQKPCGGETYGPCQASQMCISRTTKDATINYQCVSK